jgi:diacylglycerol O-acyltransferase / wax synthase
MKQLSGIDAGFLHMESPTTYGHVASLNVFDRSDTPEGATYEAMQRVLLEHMHEVPLFRRRLVDVPLGLDLPYWIEDPSFDLDFHLRHHAVPPPGTDEQLAEIVSRIIARPLDRSRPLWEMYLIEGLAGGRVAQLTKIHHAAIDGAAGAQLLAIMFDTDPNYRPSGANDDWHGERIPTDGELLARTAVEYVRRPEKMIRLGVRTLREMAASTQSGGLRALADLASQPLPGPFGNVIRQRLRGNVDEDAPPALPIGRAPRTPFNRVITGHRRFAFVNVPLAEAKKIKNAYGVTFNDVVMALCSATLRRYLDERGALPDEPLVAMVPVSIRTGNESETYQNRVSAMFGSLHTNEKDPVDRLQAISASMVAAKELHAAIPADALTDFTRFAPPAIAARAMRLYSRMRIADRMNPPFNLVISNVPGPNVPLYAAGARLEHFYPVSTVIDGQGLNMTVQSYNGSLDFGFVSCRELVPDLWDMKRYLLDAVQELLDTL